MESLTEIGASETQAQEPEKKAVKAPDRIALSPEDTKKLDQWLYQITLMSKGFLQISRGDLVSFLIRSHKEELGTAEMKKLRRDHYDPIRHIQWITPQIKAALACSDLARVAELQNELRSVELSSMDTTGVTGDMTAIGTGDALPTKKVRKRSKKTEELKPELSQESQDV